VGALAEASIDLGGIIASAGTDLGEGAAESRGGGDLPTRLDVRADELFVDALSTAPVRAVASEEQRAPVELDPTAEVVVALDPLDGSSNIAINGPVGTVFSLYPALDGEPMSSFLVPTSHQLAAGFVLYGPATILILTVGDGTHGFVLDPAARRYELHRTEIWVPDESREFAVNASNHRHWDDGVRAFVDELVAGERGPLGADHNLRWVAALVADAYRILTRGGLYLYPGDARPGYQSGRLRLLYEAGPIAALIEQAGGRATDGFEPILERRIRSLHERTPLVFGSAGPFSRFEHHQRYRHDHGTRSPLFADRGLFRR
jgi:fructose-1,6-bisphosphatase I